MDDRAVRQNFEREPLEDHHSQIWCCGFREDLNVIFLSKYAQFA
jgi:hypothetical protein